jgi:hypothetical protein
MQIRNSAAAARHCSLSPLSRRQDFLQLFAVLTFTAALIAPRVPMYGANPADGSIDATATAAVEWDGDIPGVPPAVGVVQESTCVDGGNCDIFTLTVNGAPEDWAGKQVVIKLTWDLPSTDYDLYVHKDSLSGTLVSKGSNGGSADANPTEDQAAVNPATSGTGKYIVHVLYGVTTPADQYHGAATVETAEGPTPEGDAPATRSANYIIGGMSFSDNIPLKAPLTLRDGEPSNRTDFLGNCYVGGIRGVPAGVDLWYIDLNPSSPTFDPKMRVPFYRGQPDAFSPTTEADLGGDGGGDIDLAVSFGLPTGQNIPTLAFSSLVLANISTANSVDGGKTFQKNPLGNGTGGAIVDDRQWEEFLGTDVVYLYYRTLAPAITQIQRSTDGGRTFGLAKTGGTTTQVGPIDVHQATGDVYGATSQGTVLVGLAPTPGAEPLTYTVSQAASDPNAVNHLFFIVKVADDGTAGGTLYVCYSNDHDIYLRHSTDKGTTWSVPVRVNDGTTTKTNVFPWMETGPTPGSVGVVWYGTPNPDNDDAAEWKVYFAQSFDATADMPTFRIAEVTEPEHVIHAANISEGGLTGAANRNLIDYFQVSFDPNGAAMIAYTDDHNDYDGHTYVSRQITGPSIIDGTALPQLAEGGGLYLPPGDEFPPRVPGLNGEQVVDHALDLQESSLARVKTPDASDVLSTRYDTSGTGESLAIAATMRVSDLSVIPGQTTWQMSFTANAPHSVVSPTGTYSFGASDHGDQFFLEADTNADGSMDYSYGTVARASDGKLIYTKIGNADTGQFNQDDNTISVQVTVAKLNAALPDGHTSITNGSVIAGLRSRSYTVEVVPPVSGQASRQGRRDIARGGTQFVVHDSAFPAPAATPASTPEPSPSVAPGTTPEPTPPRIQLANISSRVAVQTGNNVGIGGFIIRTTANKRVMVRGIGPSLKVGGTPLAGSLQDPVIELRDQSGALITSNDNWREGAEGAESQEAAITASGLAPADDKEAALIANLPGGNYTAIVKGAEDSEGLGLIEIYDLEAESFADLGNISTRGTVGTGDDVLIGGFIVRDTSSLNQSQSILVRGIGPSLPSNQVPGKLADPTLELFNAQGALLGSNDDWRAASNQAAINASTLAPLNDKEAAILSTLAPGAYTAVLRGANNTTGIGLVEVYNLGNQ